MPRPKTCRRIGKYPDFWSFAPEGVEVSETVVFTLDEFETVRMVDYLKLTQEECAAAMDVSRATVTSIYESARYKMADAMLNGKRLRITGGCYRIDSIPASKDLNEKGENIMRIAVTYELGEIGQHFGKTEQFKVYDVENGEIKSSQVIDTNGNGHGALAGFLRAAEVEVLICGGIGMGARNALAEVGIKLFPGASGNADENVKNYLAGNLNYDPDTQCHHHDHEHEEGHNCHHGNCGSTSCH
ncbi:MAG: DUF134 domain-containing protein [Lachnospiraceae bacterium]|nr:DUF134 domain-containing protein [Lachnospiraceae bacterium]